MTIVHDTSDLEGKFAFEFWFLDREPKDSDGSFEGINLVTKDVTCKSHYFINHSHLSRYLNVRKFALLNYR